MCGYRGGGGGLGTRISHLVSRHVKADFCVVIGGGGAQKAQMSHIVSRNIKAEFCVTMGGGGGQGGGQGTANIIHIEHTCQNYQHVRSRGPQSV